MLCGSRIPALVSAGNINERITCGVAIVGCDDDVAARSREFTYKGAGYAGTAPATVKAEGSGTHAAAHGGVADKRHAAPGLRLGAVEGDREDDAGSFVVIGHEQAGVLRLQGVPGIDDFFAVGDAIRIAFAAGIYIGVQVQFGQHHPSGSLVGASIFILARSNQIAFDGFHLAFHVVEYFFCGSLAREEGTHFVFLRHERHIAEHIQGMPVAQAAQETGLRAELNDVGAQGGIHATAVQFGVGRFPDEFIAQRDLVKNPVVHGRDELVLRIPVLLFEVVDVAVVPGDHGLVGRKFLGFPVLAEVGREALVDTADVGLAGRALLAAECEAGVQFGEYVAVGSRVVVNRSRSNLIWVQWDGIQIFKTGYRKKGNAQQEERSDFI